MSQELKGSIAAKRPLSGTEDLQMDNGVVDIYSSLADKALWLFVD